MVGIKNYAVYIPRYRISREVIGKAWEARGGRGERAVANHDEDCITMSADAILRCKAGEAGRAFDGLFFASTTAPYKEKQNASTLAAAADLPEDGVLTADFGGSLRCGTAALKAAVDAVKAGSAKNALVAVSDMRLVEPGNALEGALGDAAAALWIGSENLIATIDCVHSVAIEFLDVWRRDCDVFLRSEDAKFISSMGYEKHLKRAFDGLLKKAGLSAGDINKIALYAPDAGAYKGQIKILGAKPESFAADSLIDTVGCAGSAASFLSLAQALDAAKPGDKIALLGFGNGADAILLTATDAVENAPGRGCLAAQLAWKRPLNSYAKYLKFRGLVESESYAPFAPYPLEHREQTANLRLYAKKCMNCGTLQFPPRRICWNCSTKDMMEDTPLPRTGAVYTFTKDFLVPTPEPPVIMVSADLDGGGRFYGQLTDCDPAEAAIGKRVALCFRRLHEGGGFHNYFWKFRPEEEK
jgi:3-hydroxy-3-methylglutaryl CoA synthase